MKGQSKTRSKQRPEKFLKYHHQQQKKKMLFQVKTVNHYFISHCIVLYITQKLHLIEIKRIELMWQQFQE